MSILLREKLNEYSPEKIQQISETAGIKNAERMSKDVLINTLVNVFETLEEFNSIFSETYNEKLLSNYSVFELRGIYNYCFSNVGARDIRNIRKEKLIKDLSNISDIENIINEYKKNLLEKKEGKEEEESNPVIFYLNKLKKNHRRLLCKNLNIKNYVNMKKEEVYDSICEIIDTNGYTVDDIDNILKGVHFSVKNINQNNILNILESISDEKIKYIVHIADIHIRRNERISEYRSVFDNLYEDLKSKYDYMKNKTVIVCCGDIFHYKTTQRAEGLCLWNYFVKKMTELHPFICIIGNHDVDLTTNNIDWIKPLDGIIDDFYYLDKTGRYRFRNVEFGVSSLITGDILQMKKESDDITYIQLYHGAINGHVIFNNQRIDTPYKVEDFGFFDYMLLGDIHKFQYLDADKKVCYPGSLIQQNRGESVYDHGYVLWNLETKTSEFHEVQNDYCFLKVEVENNNLVYDKNILDNKKYLNITYVLKDETKEEESLIQDFKDKLEGLNIKIVREDYDKYCDAKEDIKNLLVKDIPKDKRIEDYIKEKLKTDSIDEKKVEQILEIHSNFLKEDLEEEGSCSKWFLRELKFKNIFSYGNNIENEIIFDNSGFYKIFGQNYLGKSSILNMIKWLFYGEESGINDCDVLHKSKNSPNEGYVKASFKIGNYTYYLSKELIRSSKKCGFDNNCKLLIFENENKIEEIFGSENTEVFLRKLIGNYKQFEIIASINNNDIGILKEKKILTVFNKLFKLDKFELYEEKTKDKIKTLNTEIKTLLNIKNNYSENYTLKISKTKLDIKRIQDLIDACKDAEYEEKIAEQKQRLEELNNELSKIFMKEERVCESQEQKIKDLTKELKKLSSKKLDFNKIKTNLVKLEQEYDEITLNVNSLNKQIKEVEELDSDEVKEDLQTELESKKKLIEEISNSENSITELQNKNNDLILKMVNLSMDENEIQDKIKNQGYNYKIEKEKVVAKLSGKAKITNEDKQMIIKLLLDQDYHSLLETLRNNEVYQDEIDTNNNEIESLKKKLKVKRVKLSECENRISSLEDDLAQEKENERINENNKKILEKIKNLEEKMKKIKTKINTEKEEYDESLKIKDKVSDIESQIEIASLKNKQYEEYLEAVEYNKKYKKMYNDINLDLQNVVINLDKLKKEDMNIKFQKKTYNVELNTLNKELVSYEEKKDEYIKITEEIMNKNFELENLKIYKNLINEKGIPSIILEDKIPNIEKHINTILTDYTNFNISIEMNGNGTKKRIDIFQIKNKKTETKLTINSCSGYELFILNIAFKIAIKNFCYINCPSFICIDEVWEKISEENYDKLHKIFDLLSDNYKNILVISHIEQIKNYLEENYSGKHINITKDMSDNYSFIQE